MTVTVLCLGQSQMAGWFVFGSAPNRGADAFQSQLAGLLGVSPSTVVMLNGAVGGTAADRQAAVDPTNATLDIEAGHGMWWWDLEADSGAGAPGPIMTRAEGIADDSGLTIDLILWAQGHQDAAGHYYPPAGASPDPTPDRFETATRAIFARLRSLYGANIPIVIQELDTPWDLGPPPSYVLYAPQIAVLRQRQLDIVLDTDDTYFGASTTQYGLASYRQESFGYLHFTDETYRLVAQAMARSAAGILGSPADLVTDPTVTARLRLPYLAEAMLNADVAINEGLDILDSRVGTAVFSDQLTSPPAGPAVGDLYLVPASPTGAWAGQTDRVARWDGGAWLFYPPEAGWRLYVVASDAFRYWDGDQWLTEQIGTASASGVTNDSGVTGDSVADALDALDAAKADSAGLATIATSGDYADLTGTPPLDALAAAVQDLQPIDRPELVDATASDGTVPWLVTTDNYVLGRYDATSGEVQLVGILSREQLGGLFGGAVSYEIDPAAAVVPICTGALGEIIAGYDRASGSFVARGLATAETRRLPATAVVRPQRSMRLGFGQSLRLGVDAGVLSASQPYANLSFVGGPRERSGTEGPLIETLSGDGNSGETGMASAANGWSRWAAELYDVDWATAIVWASTAAVGSTAIADLSQGTAAYTEALAHVTAAEAFAVTAGESFACMIVDWSQGQQDGVVGTTYGAYRAALESLAADLDADIRAATGQTQPVRTLVTVLASRATSQPQIIRAQVDACDEDTSGLLYLVTPEYPFQMDPGGIHMTATGYWHRDQYSGRAAAQLIDGSQSPDRIRVRSVTARGTEVTLRLWLPRPPLRLDVDLLPLAQDYGLAVVDSEGPLTIESVALTTEGDGVRITVDRALEDDPRLRYALDHLGAGLVIFEGGSGNLRDSTTDVAWHPVTGAAYPLPHWCPPFDRPIIVL